MKPLLVFAMFFVALSAVQAQELLELLQFAILDLSNEIKALREKIKECATKDDIKALNISLGEYATKDDIKEALDISLGECATKDDIKALNISLGEYATKDDIKEALDISLGDNDDYNEAAYVGIYNETWLSSGEKVDPNLYHNNEPSGSPQFCGHFHLNKTCLGLGDRSCEEKRPFLCQYQI
ncbi:uncharacterized protein [Palaemon carinicauda]|uniref:uncharacterized protein isoform X4 n=1 Tax=Palaemon carinicauda TaxID=392227 RepID=UPI0035B5E4F8